MIGLSANRLSASRLAGLTSEWQHRNGQWIERSPYSAAATRALKAAFSAEQWAIIRDYGFAHPEIVGYMNAYAVEDAKIAMSLVPGIGTRWLVGDTNGNAYIDTGFVPTNNTSIGMKMQFTRINSSSDKSCLFGSRKSYSSNCITWGWGNSSWYVTGDTCFTSWGKSPSYQMLTRPLDLLPHTLLLDKGAYYIDGSLIYTYTSAAFTCPYNLYIFNLRQDGGLLPNGLNSDGQIAEVKVSEDGTPVREMYPFIRNGVNGMIDVLSGTFYQNAGTGQFTISETPAS